MKLAHIIPPAWEGRFKVPGYRMALAHWVLKYPGYALKIRRTAEYVILDTGSFEGQQVTRAQLAQAAEAISADEIVLPDILGEAKETLLAANAALGHVASSRVMFVPQGRTLEEWRSCLAAWLNQWEAGPWRSDYVLTIGITSLRHVKEVNRSQLLQELVVDKSNYPVHLLGVGNIKEFGLTELPLASKLGVRGVDTSTAFAQASEGKLLTLDSPKVRLGDPEKYEKLPTWQFRLANLNVAILNRWIEKGKGSETIPTYVIRQTASKWLKYWAEGFAELELVMRACGMPKGRYALLKVRRREKYVRPLTRSQKPTDKETLVEVKK